MNLTLRREEDLFLTKSAEGYEVPVDIELLKEIYEISQDIQDVEDNDHRDYLKDFDEVEIEYSEFALIEHRGGW
jgi:antitoxin component of RelBE/YafQ-DinJ toxin-antitoxin module|tara:strand:+ start:223 stop:444 length:222 start_codon:yes stop_codon:yes gene_type:complete